MSGGSVCSCEESKKLLLKRNWRVVDYKCNYSYFGHPKGGPKPSAYSELRCETCRARWRTKAKYVDKLYLNQTGVKIS